MHKRQLLNRIFRLKVREPYEREYQQCYPTSSLLVCKNRSPLVWRDCHYQAKNTYDKDVHKIQYTLYVRKHKTIVSKDSKKGD